MLKENSTTVLTPSPVKGVTVICGEGRGRSVLTHAALIAHGLPELRPGILIRHAGLQVPQSGEQWMHPKVARVALNRFGVDISSWPWEKLNEGMVDPGTVTVLLTDRPAPGYTRRGRGQLIAEIHDPAETGDLQMALEIAACQISNIAWLLVLALTGSNQGRIGLERGADGLAVPQEVTIFAPKGGDPRYELSGFTFAGQAPIMQ